MLKASHQYAIACLALTLHLLCGAIPASASVFAKSYALVIGIDRYPSKHWESLDHAKKDAFAMATFLDAQGYEVRSLTDTQATRERILHELSDYLAERLKADDRVVIFFSGHGETRKLGGRAFGYVIPHDGNDDFTTWISMDEIRTISQQMGEARHQLFIFDSCYGGQFATRSRLSSIATDHPRYIEKISENRARQYITAGGEDQRVRDRGPDGYSYFTGYLLRGLSGFADMNGDSYVTSSELYSFLQPAASNWDQTPHAGVLSGHEQGDFWFRVADDDTVSAVGIGGHLIAPLRSIAKALKLKGPEKTGPATFELPKKEFHESGEVASIEPTRSSEAEKPRLCRTGDDFAGQIPGIKNRIQNMLYDIGICTFEDLANSYPGTNKITRDDVEALAGALKEKVKGEDKFAFSSHANRGDRGLHVWIQEAKKIIANEAE